MRIFNQSRNLVLAEKANVAASFWGRFWGLMGKPSMNKGQALVIKPCRSVHTWFMRFDIDVLFLDGAWRVVCLIPEMKPFRASRVIWKARTVIELPVGTLSRTNTSLGDVVLIE